jgi:hypothetical protein
MVIPMHDILRAHSINCLWLEVDNSFRSRDFPHFLLSSRNKHLGNQLSNPQQPRVVIPAD